MARNHSGHAFGHDSTSPSSSCPCAPAAGHWRGLRTF